MEIKPTKTVEQLCDDVILENRKLKEKIINIKFIVVIYSIFCTVILINLLTIL